MEGNEKANLCMKSVGWLQRQDKNAEPWLWKLSNCFSTVDQALPTTGEQMKEKMEKKRPTIELKDVPPPPAPPLKSCTSIIPLSKLQPPPVTQIPLQTGPKPASNNVIDGKKIWPNIVPPGTQTAAVPMYNGCGAQGNMKDTAIFLAKAFCKAPQKYGASEMSAAGQMQENLPPIGVFWDIENCSVPSGRSAVMVVKRIRERLFKGHREAEFICVCDISKENKEVIEELNNCQVTVAHINATAKNAADDKLRQSLRRFADTHTSPATVVLVSKFSYLYYTSLSKALLEFRELARNEALERRVERLTVMIFYF
ncbi:meiosis regulator and mRNA stability factor 1 [Hyperolius riggenbachi]|uniref:meiosis regulator and mRNA stability factor 1 n=1 Tax=Hyperolius riggenbachi TaxID=752182 RepID=UPI0035A386A6